MLTLIFFSRVNMFSCINSSRVMNVAYPNGQFGGNLPGVGFPGRANAGGDNTDALVQQRVLCGHCNESFIV